MAFVGALKLLAVGSLISASVAKPIEPRFQNDNDDTPLPLVIWHGLGDTYQADGIRHVAEIAEEVNPGTLTYLIRMDEDASRDRLVTFGSQHNGISNFRECEPTDWICRIAMAVVKGDAWNSAVQSTLVPAQYYRNPDEYEQYLENSNFLADINNEREEKNEQYKKNIANLENFVMYMFEDDKTVIPKETAWFEDVNGTETTPLRARKLYSEDWLGLRQLDRKGGLKFRLAPGEHMKLTEDILKEAFGDFYGPLNPHRGRSEPRPKHVHNDDL
ncbi:hypothetical protein CHGG_04107 [Chaetomium globosum CBS 148.51]|uniref:Palmitoyl-protein thioesterase 1 n=1 Tax=Chaetomium globosum (strain ATCC 6205 / CBS 148.51 / DSM 1962 / NBRC 6347 / NRRL 1970) TaxID=306901 RepID=Q2H289_CHAGB|nr:uncharacterized protein CHGG_04107 [Chaetomium globosum CBS 148.51]EAQ87488.1 hypothetical protein CHGG_04107 [Chaetomium globosum CBS 148.51]